MPWELGYFDGFRPNHTAILPLVDDDQTAGVSAEQSVATPRQNLAFITLRRIGSAVRTISSSRANASRCPTDLLTCSAVGELPRRRVNSPYVALRPPRLPFIRSSNVARTRAAKSNGSTASSRAERCDAASRASGNPAGINVPKRSKIIA